MAMFSQTAEYALRAVVHLATVEDEPAPQTVGQIAAVTRVPAGYLSKVLQSLTRAGLITSQRGLGGGFRLAKAASAISIYEVIQAVDPIQRINYCPLGLPGHGKNLCSLHKRMDAAMALIEEQFRAATIGQLLEEPLNSENLPLAGHPCSFPLRDAGV